MFITTVDASLEKMLRARLPLPETMGDVVFEAPSGTWSAQLSRITINLFLYDVQRSTHPGSPPAVRPGENGAATMRRRPQPMFQLGYLVSAWAGSERDEHQLLGDVISLLAGIEKVPDEHVVGEAGSPIRLSLGDERSLGREIWTAAGGTLKASISLQVTVAADTFDWEEQAPLVERIAAMASRMDDPRRA